MDLLSTSGVILIKSELEGQHEPQANQEAPRMDLIIQLEKDMGRGSRVGASFWCSGGSPQQPLLVDQPGIRY